MHPRPTLRSEDRIGETPEEHHTVPESRGGSNKKVNLTPVDAQRHDRFHVIFGNPTPLDSVRLLATGAVGFQDRTITPIALQTIYRIADAVNWFHLYKDGCLVKGGERAALGQHPAELYNSTTAMQTTELHHLDSALNGVKHGKGFASDRIQLVRQANRFFNVDHPVKAMTALLSEEHQGKLTWVDSLRDDVREELIATVQDMELVALTDSIRPELRGIIAAQRAHLLKDNQAWIRDYEREQQRRRAHKHHPETRIRGSGRR